ncbi:putative multi-domain containing protein [Aduncisulcus paluster]|uniref:Multi-domain containing protein n=1 Tax=Aduncisulcus paluster TaxID=2918883 RepID=A0ABQ5KVE9_9EUKA|nr:putative multi-domain containing protein [Aduncisulcus paluster]
MIKQNISVASLLIILLLFLLKFELTDGCNLQVQIFQISDVHGWVDGHTHNTDPTLPPFNGDAGDLVSFMEHAQSQADAQKIPLLFFDSGDDVQGTGLSDADSPVGSSIWEFFSEFGLDGVTMGNHDDGEVDSMPWLYSHIDDLFPGSYITSNQRYKNSSDIFGNSKYKTIEIEVTHTETHETISIQVGVAGVLYADAGVGDVIVIPSAELILEDDFSDFVTNHDILIILAHISSDDPEIETLRQGIREIAAKKPILFLTGHSHQWRSGVCPYGEGTDLQSFYSEPGCYLEGLGKIDLCLSETPEGIIFESTPTVEQIVMNRDILVTEAGYESYSTFLTPKGEEIQTQMDLKSQELGLNNRLGCSKHLYDSSLLPTEKESFLRLYNHSILPAYLYPSIVPYLPSPVEPILSIMNSGSIRGDMYEGPVLVNDLYTIIPFDNYFCYTCNVCGTLLTTVLNTMNTPDRPNHYMLAISVDDLDPDADYCIVASSYDAGLIQTNLQQLDPDSNVCANSPEEWLMPAVPNSSESMKSILVKYMQEQMTCDNLIVRVPGSPSHLVAADEADVWWEKHKNEGIISGLFISILLFILLCIFGFWIISSWLKDIVQSKQAEGMITSRSVSFADFQGLA